MNPKRFAELIADGMRAYSQEESVGLMVNWLAEAEHTARGGANEPDTDETRFLHTIRIELEKFL